ncbi:uncharacterized protein LTR77_010162 [Saxophila tyrrhenica]|uniref:Uncharacterized protein n=1 Tax=Saxophila tyrrhenica TaxID=1690608 RepID=A0AAV9NW02_9PEZI|nr:hypothetical protein LTR77_010162 [Saxophila tyrrhenica]
MSVKISTNVPTSEGHTPYIVEVSLDSSGSQTSGPVKVGKKADARTSAAAAAEAKLKRKILHIVPALVAKIHKAIQPAEKADDQVFLRVQSCILIKVDYEPRDV